MEPLAAFAAGYGNPGIVVLAVARSLAHVDFTGGTQTDMSVNGSPVAHVDQASYSASPTAARVLTPEQKADLKLFLNRVKAGGQPDDEFLRDSVDEIAAYKLRGRQSQQRDAAVALYHHRLRMMAVREQGKK